MVKRTLYEDAVEAYGKETAEKMWQRAVDPVTGYISKDRAADKLLDGKIPCRRCGGMGLCGIRDPEDEDFSPELVLCLKCWDEWGDDASRLLKKHGYVYSKKKWLAAFTEFCSTKPKVIDIKAHNQDILNEQRLLDLQFPKHIKRERV